MDCELCQMPGTHAPLDEGCVKEIRRKLKLADEMFSASTALVTALGDPILIKDEKLVQKVLDLDLVTWRYAM